MCGQFHFIIGGALEFMESIVFFGQTQRPIRETVAAIINDSFSWCVPNRGISKIRNTCYRKSFIFDIYCIIFFLKFYNQILILDFDHTYIRGKSVHKLDFSLK